MRLRQTLLLGTLLLVSSPPFAFAQAQQPPQEQPRQPQQQPVARLNVAELESLAAPIAFYKDQVIENILAAAQDPVAIQKYVATEKSATNAAQPSESLVFLSAHPNLLKQLGAGEFPHKADMLALASRLPLLDVNDAVIEAVAAYIANHVMPNDPGGDAFHL